jgi:3-dehydroquinate synthase class II
VSKASKKTDRRITPLEHAQLKKDAAAVEAARDVIDDATVALNSAKAAADVVAVPAQRRAVALARRYKIKPNEEIDIESGVIQLKPPAPPVQG